MRDDGVRLGHEHQPGRLHRLQCCTIACQAENNIPVVGKAEVRRGREMHWIRVDRYYEGAAEQPHSLFPAGAVHALRDGALRGRLSGRGDRPRLGGPELQVYNRCIGTRFCSNNCPYKVRRFNFLQYSDEDTESLKGSAIPR